RREARARLSASFHGRDLFAPVAVMLARGDPPPGRPRSDGANHRSVIRRCRLDVRITLKSGRRSDIGSRPKSAISGYEQSQQRSPSFDHLVGALLQKQTNVETEPLCSLEVDDQFEISPVRPPAARP